MSLPGNHTLNTIDLTAYTPSCGAAPVAAYIRVPFPMPAAEERPAFSAARSPRRTAPSRYRSTQHVGDALP